MVEAGSVEIVGRINVEQIKHGLRELKSGLDSAKESARSAFGDMKRMGNALSGIAGPLSAIGAGLISATLGIAAMSPQVAPVLARMQTDFQRLSRILGEELRPVFEKFGGMFRDFVEWMDGDGRPIIEALKNALSLVGDSLMAIGNGAIFAAKELGKIGGTISTTFDFAFGEGAMAELLEWMVKHGALPAAAALVGWKIGGPTGALVAGAGTAVIQETGYIAQGGQTPTENLASGAMAGAGVGALTGLVAGATVPFAAVGAGVGAMAMQVQNYINGFFEALQSGNSQEAELNYWLFKSSTASTMVFGDEILKQAAEERNYDVNKVVATTQNMQNQDIVGQIMRALNVSR